MKIKPQQKMLLIAAIAAVLLFLAYKPILDQAKTTETEPKTMSLIVPETVINQVFCGACVGKTNSIVNVNNPNPDQIYNVWIQGEFKGQYRKQKTEFTSTCGNQIIVCFAENAASDGMCPDGQRGKAEFGCTEQTINVK